MYPFFCGMDTYLMAFLNQSTLLPILFNKFLKNVKKHGEFTDKLGDVFEEYIIELFQSKNLSEFDFEIKNKILNTLEINDIYSCNQLNIPKNNHGGNSKTDIALCLNNKFVFKASVKQSTVRNVAVAEFKVDDILAGIDIDDLELEKLLTKHQIDASAKNFSSSEKSKLKELLMPIKEIFVRWVLTGSKEESVDDVRCPEFILSFKMKYDKNSSLTVDNIEIKDFGIFTINDAIAIITKRASGFNTGLSFTYATGSKGKKIQFKAPVL